MARYEQWNGRQVVRLEGREFRILCAALCWLRAEPSCPAGFSATPRDCADCPGAEACQPDRLVRDILRIADRIASELAKYRIGRLAERVHSAATMQDRLELLLSQKNCFVPAEFAEAAVDNCSLTTIR